MNQPNNRTPNLGSKALALAVSVSCANAYAQQPEDCTNNQDQQQCQTTKKPTKQIEIVEVYGVNNAMYRAARSGDVRHSADLADTPLTISVLTQNQILESGKSDLKEILSSQAGVTLGTGENGNAFGDRYVIRGHEARSDVFVDGLRDPGMTTRESFATEQIEITKGPSATFAGRGSSGGAVNSITKQASPNYDFTIVEAGIGTDDHHRVTLDSNLVVSEEAAVRVNLLNASETKPGRDGIEKQRTGALLSGYLEASLDTNFIADVYYLKADDVPDLGSYFDREARKPVSDIPVYAQSNDFLDTEVVSTTLRINHKINENFSLYNATRYGKTENGYITTGARGSNRADSDPQAPGAATISLSTHNGWQEVEYFANQYNLLYNNSIGDTTHKWVFGAEFSKESVDNGVYNIAYTGQTNCLMSSRRSPEPQASYCGLDENGEVVTNINELLGREYSKGNQDSDYKIKTLSAYVMDTIRFDANWELFLGARVDSFDYTNTVNGRGGVASFDYSDTLLNGHAGLVYHMNDEANVYLTYASASNINGGESDVGGSCGYGGLCGSPDQVQQSDPERVRNIELGTKWELFDDRLLASAAVFQITKDDVMESVGDAYSSIGTLNTGENRVEGAEVQLSGSITDQLSVQASVSVMDSEVLASINPDNVGLALSNFADKSAYLQLRYQPTDNFAFGASVTYKGEMYGGQPDSAAGYSSESGQYSIVVPSYHVIDLFANWYATENLNFRLNVGNLTDEEYWTAAYRSGSFMYLGEARSVRLSMTWKL